MMQKRRSRPPLSSIQTFTPSSPQYNFSEQSSGLISPGLSSVSTLESPMFQTQRKIGSLAGFFSGDGLLNQNSVHSKPSFGLFIHQPQIMKTSTVHSAAVKQVFKGEGVLESYSPSLISVLHRLKEGSLDNNY